MKVRSLSEVRAENAAKELKEKSYIQEVELANKIKPKWAVYYIDSKSALHEGCIKFFAENKRKKIYPKSFFSQKNGWYDAVKHKGFIYARKSK